MTRPRATWKEVAERAGVSQSAVSRSFTPGASVSPATRARVEAAAHELGYRPALAPHILKGGESSLVAIVAGGLYNPYFTEVLDRLVQRLADVGKRAMIVKAQSDTDLDEAIDELSRHRVDAVVSALAVSSRRAADALNRWRIPIVTLNSGFAGDWLRSVNSDNRSGGRQAFELLRALGCVRPCYFSGGGGTPDARRLAGFRQAAEAAGVAAETVACGFDHDDGHRELLVRFASADPPDGIFCVNDLVACGVVDGLRELGIEVPRDVAVIGYDDIPMAAWQPYALTTFSQTLPRLVDGVLRMLEPAPARHTLNVPPLLVRRRSA